MYGVDKDLLSIKLSNNINGLIQFNNVFYENKHQKKYIFLGENNISWYVYDIKLNTYFELDNPSGMEINKFINFKDMLKSFLLDAIYIYIASKRKRIYSNVKVLYHKENRKNTINRKR